MYRPTENSNSNPSGDASLEVYLLGVVDFDSAVALQNRLVFDVSGRDDGQGTLLLCEHPPLLTVGREGSRSDILPEQHELQSRQIDVRWLNRGGGCMVHALGQLAIYPILPLARLGIGLNDYRRRLEESVIDVCGEMRVAATRNDDEPGVWCRSGQIAQLGVAVKSWVSYHGLFLNVSPAMELMRMIRRRPSESRVTSLAAQRMCHTSMHAVREAIVRRLVERLGFDRFHIYTGHPLLKRTRKPVYVPA